MLIPIMISFTNIIFREKVFVPFFPLLVRLVLFSASVHQVVFLIFSSLPVAVAQIQDAGLVFLSTIASNISMNEKLETGMIPTVVIALGLSTVGMGCVFLIIGKLQWAQAVQYFPVPVLGAFLAYVGFFSGQAAMSLLSGHAVTNIYDWVRLRNEQSIMLILPGIVAGILMYLSLLRIEKPYVLQACLLVILVIFYTGLIVTGTSVQQARDLGWLMEANTQSGEGVLF